MSNESNNNADQRCLPHFVRLERGDGQAASPAYSSNNYEDFCQCEKEKGLRRDLWHTLPQMWKEELKFRAEFEEALAKFCEPNNKHIYD